MKLLLSTAAVTAAAGAASAPLPAYNAELNGTTVSGLSSGGFFAVQMHVAFSDFISGAGVFAGGPYDCARGSLSTAELTCMQALTPPEASTYEGITESRAKAGSIAAPGNLAAHNVYLFSGKDDTTVHPPVMNALNDYYKHYITQGTVTYVNTMAAAHTQPTDDPEVKNACSVSAAPYLSDCHYDGAGAALQTIVPGIKPRNNGTLSGSLIEFSQGEFFKSGVSMAANGFVYVPASCAGGARCSVHVSFHGCEQDYAAVGDAYTAHAGYNKWADTNNMIVLYPQTIKSFTDPSNPNACWDWWGYAGTDYDVQAGAQMAGVRKMLDRVTSGHPALPAPKDVHVTGVTNSSVDLAWDAVTGAATYQVERDGTVVAAAVAATKYSDTGLASGTSYSYVVEAIDSGSSAGAPSAAVNATTSGKPPPPPPLDPPTGLAVGTTTNTTITVTWDADPAAASFTVYADGAAVAAQLTATTYTQKDLQPETSHTYEVSAVNAAGAESAKSAPVTGKTAPSFQCQQFTASNYAHVQAGRAHDVAGRARANGSDQDMGLDNTFYKTTLAETSAAYYVIGQCP